MYIERHAQTQSFNDQIEMIITKVKSTKKSIFVCGDLNIDLLKYNENNGHVVQPRT